MKEILNILTFILTSITLLMFPLVAYCNNTKISVVFNLPLIFTMSFLCNIGVFYLLCQTRPNEKP